MERCLGLVGWLYEIIRYAGSFQLASQPSAWGSLWTFHLRSSVAAPAPALISTFQLVQKIKRRRKAHLLTFKTPFGSHTWLLLTSLWLDLCHGSKESGKCSLYFRWPYVQLKVRGCIIKEEGENRKWGPLTLCGTIIVLQADPCLLWW